MIGLLLAAGLLGLGGLEAVLAPDQLLPVVYLDEPLLLEITPGDSGVHDVLVSLTAAGSNDTHTTVLERELLEAGRARWFTVPFMDAAPGPYLCRVRLDDAAGEVLFEGQVTRVERPHLAMPMPIFADVSTAPPATAGLLALAGIRTVRLPHDHPQWNGWLEEIRRWQLSLLPISRLEEATALADALSAQFPCTALAGWHLTAPQDDAPLATPPALRCNILPLWRLSHDAMGPPGRVAPQHAILEGHAPLEQVVALDDQWARAHFQDAARMDWYIPYGEEVAADPHALIKLVITAWAAGADTFGVDHRYIDPGTIAPFIPLLQALPAWLRDGEYVGQAPAPKGITAHLFRKQGQWLLAAWTQDGQPAPLDTAALSKDKQLVARDAWFRETALPQPWTITGAPQFLQGQEFDVVRAILDQRARAAVAAFNLPGDVAQFIPPLLSEYLSAMAQEPRISPDRKRYLALLTLFPDIEQRWHSGRIPGETAKTLLALLRELVLALAALEEFSGDPFLEPLQETLARCGEYQSVYLTNSSSDQQNKKRGDWLLQEIRALGDKADWLADHGRPIEASAVALCAEWRARSLDFASKAGPYSERTLAEVTGQPAPGVAPTTPGQPRNTRKVTHTVKRGDTFAGICKQYGVLLKDFLEWNKVQPNKTLRIGDTYIVYAPVSEAPPAAPAEAAPAMAPPPEPAPAEAASAPAAKEITHTVKRGENPSIIAGKYNVPLDDLLKWNKLTKRSVLNIGDKLAIRKPGN